MANAEYYLGSTRYVVVELERTALSADFTPGNWTYDLALVPMGEDFDETTAAWASAVYELATDAAGQTSHTIKSLLPSLTTVAGKFRVFYRMTAIGAETETPQWDEVAGIVTVK